MTLGSVVLLSVGGVLVGGMVLLAWLLRGASSTLNPFPRNFALSQTEHLYKLLTSECAPSPHYLLAISPTRHERRALAEVVASISCNIVECRRENVRRVVEAWELEEVVEESVLRSRSRGRGEKLERLLHLHPSEECVRRVVRRPFDIRQGLFGQLLLVVYASPERVAESLASYPVTLSWEQMGRVVEVLKMRLPILPCYTFDGDIPPNVKMLALRLAANERVGNAAELAHCYAYESDTVLRNSALGVLMELSHFPPASGTKVGC